MKKGKPKAKPRRVVLDTIRVGDGKCTCAAHTVARAALEKGWKRARIVVEVLE